MHIGVNRAGGRDAAGAAGARAEQTRGRAVSAAGDRGGKWSMLWSARFAPAPNFDIPLVKRN
jgi:hypothetical protein